MPRRPPGPPPPPPGPAWTPAPHQVIFARRMQNAVNRYRPRMYAYPVQFEPIQGGRYETEVTFECVETHWYNTNALGMAPETFWRTFPQQPVARVTMTLGPSINRTAHGGIDFQAQIDGGIDHTANGLVEDRRWYLLTLVDEFRRRPPLAQMELLGAHGDYEAPVELSVMRIETAPAGVAADLAAKYRIDGSGVQPQAMLDNPEVGFVGVLNVGQGGCNAIYGTDGRPFLFYDFGRSVGADSRPDSMKPCLASAPQIILSNWDKDHHELARSFPEGRHLPWLCLQGPGGPLTGGFFRSLRHTRVWPADRMKFEEYRGGFVLRSNDPGGNANDSGLVVLVRVRDDSNAPPFGQRRALDPEGARPEIFEDERYVLMTGDAMFQHIPSCEAHDLDGKIIGINAVHHGSYDGMSGFEDRIPLAAEPLDDHPATVAFSYGFNRATGTHSGGYGHPMREAVEWYKFRGYYHRINTNAEPAGIPAHYAPQNLVLGFRRGAVAAPAGMAAAAIAAARLTYDGAVTNARAAHDDTKATWLVREAARAAQGVSAAQVVADCNAELLTPAYQALVVSAPTTLAITAAILAAGGRATGPQAYTDIETLDNATYDAAVIAANAATVQAHALCVVVSAQDPAYPAVQGVHCQGAAVAAVVHAPPWPVTDPPATATTTVSPPRPALPARAIVVRERLDPALVLHNAHGLADNDQVTIAGSADPGTNAVHVITRVDANSYTIPYSRGGMPVAEAVNATRAVPGAAALNCPITDTGQPLTLVRHSEHALQAGTQVTIAAATNAAFDGASAFVPADLCSYCLQIAGVPSGTTGVTAQASGTRAREKFKELCDLVDGGMAPTTITHNNHRLVTNAYVDIQQTTHAIHSGRRRITVLNANSYTIAASVGAVFNENGVRVEGTRTQFPFLNEPVEIVVGTAVSTVTFLGHGLQTGDYVTLANGTHAAYAGSHRITWLSANAFQVNVGPMDGAAYTADVSRHVGQFQGVPVLVRDPGRVSIVEDQQHGLNSGVTVTIGGTTNFNGAHPIRCVDPDHYAIGQVTGAVRNEPGHANATVPEIVSAPEAAITMDNGGATDIWHPNHGFATGTFVTLVGGAHAGVHAVTRVDGNTYRIAHTTGGPLVESNIATVTGAAVDVFHVAGVTTVNHVGHGLAPNAVVTLHQAVQPALNGAHVVTPLDANNYTIPVAFPGYRERTQAVMASGARAVTEGEAEIPCSPTPSDAQMRDDERAQLAHGANDQKGRIVSAMAVARQFEANPATCAGARCAFQALHRH